ncbi:MAG: hypothetical protein ACK55Z_11370, partial [bacterium]
HEQALDAMPLPLATRVSRLAIQMKILATDADDGFSLGDDGEGKKKSEEATAEAEWLSQLRSPQ